MMYVAWLAAVLGHLAYLLFGPSSIATSLVLAIGLGVLLALDSQPVTAPSEGVLAGVSIALAMVSAVVLYTGVATVVAEYHHARTYTDDLMVARAHAEDAVSAAPWLYEYRAREAWLIGRTAVAATVVNAEEAEREAVVAYSDLAHFAPAEYLTYVGFARTLLALPSADEETDALAAEVSELGINIYPHGLEARALGAEAYVRLEAYEEAIALLEAEWESDPAYAQPGVVYAYALLGAGHPAEAVGVIDRLYARFPDDANVLRLVEIAGEIREAG
jgi:tetratricopeptide (TPR) repeat protein